MATIRVPATSANLGPGFDSLGIALNIYNEFTMAETGQGIKIDVVSSAPTTVPTNENNLVYRSARRLFDEVGYSPNGLHIGIKIAVPTGRGLGSSSTAIVGGLAAANEIAGKPLLRDDLFNLASKIEGHPDNVGPAIYGGFTVSYRNRDSYSAVSFKPAPELKPVILVPETTLLTKTARGVLPETVTMDDAVFNIGRSSLLVAALLTGDAALLREAMQDRLHQPYRASMIPGLNEIITSVAEFGAAGAALSGAGPSIVCLVNRSREDEFHCFIQQVLSSRNVAYTIMLSDFDLTGFTSYS